jgi:hypothetical protein
MGEEKRKRQIIEQSPCHCDSGKLAGQCCFNGRSWHKTPAVLGLAAMPQNSVTEKCYMSELGSCGGKLSKEHLISESIIELLSGGG